MNFLATRLLATAAKKTPFSPQRLFSTTTTPRFGTPQLPFTPTQLRHHASSHHSPATLTMTKRMFSRFFTQTNLTSRLHATTTLPLTPPLARNLLKPYPVISAQRRGMAGGPGMPFDKLKFTEFSQRERGVLVFLSFARFIWGSLKLTLCIMVPFYLYHSYVELEKDMKYSTANIAILQQENTAQREQLHLLNHDIMNLRQILNLGPPPIPTPLLHQTHYVQPQAKGEFFPAPNSLLGQFNMFSTAPPNQNPYSQPLQPFVDQKPVQQQQQQQQH